MAEVPVTTPASVLTPAAPSHDVRDEAVRDEAVRDEAARDEAGMYGGLDAAVHDGVTAVRFRGSIDVVVREAHVGDLGDLRGTTPMTVDCRDVEFMDSTGLSVLVRIVRDAAEDGRDVLLLGTSEQVRDLLVTTGVDVWMAGLGVRTA